MDELLTKKDVMETLRISSSTLSLIMARGELPVYRIGGQCRFKREELVAYIDGSLMPLGRVPAKKPAPAAKPQRPVMKLPKERYVSGMEWIK